MGFNVSIIGENYIDECDQFIDRAFYTLTCSNEGDDKNSLLEQMGKLFGLNLSFITDFYFDDVDFEDEFEDGEEEDGEEYTIQYTPTRGALTTINELILKIQQYPQFYETLYYDELSTGFTEKEEFGEYVNSQLVDDLQTVRNILQCYDRNGVERIYFTFG